MIIAGLIFLMAANASAIDPVSPPFEHFEGVAAPTGDEDLSFVVNYVRVASNIAVGGRLSEGGAAGMTGREALVRQILGVQ